MYALREKRQKNPGQPDMPKARDPNGPNSRVGKDRARQEKVKKAMRQDANFKEVAVLEEVRLAEPNMECTPKARCRTLETLVTTKDGTASRSAPATDASPMEVEEDPVEDITNDDEGPLSPIESFSSDDPMDASESEELKKVQKSKLVLRAKLNNFQAHDEQLEPMNPPEPSSNAALDMRNRNRRPVPRIVSKGKQKCAESSV